MASISPSQQQHPQQQQRRETRSSKSKEMIQAIPASPALSQAEMPFHGLPNGHMSEYLQHHHQTSTAFQPQEQAVNMESMHPQSRPATRYSTPVPPRSLYQPASQQQAMHYPQYSNYPQPPQYDHSPYTFTDEYGTASSQPYSTPATSPPTPSRTTELRVTRNGTYPRGGKAGTISSRPPPAASSPPPKKKPGKAKALKKSPHLSGPMSEITKDSDIVVFDIGAYVNRSTEERLHEVATGKIPGKIKRPMNAFMLYRKAYQNRAKEWCSQHNHQVVSQVCGDSWPLEPDHVRAQFTEWAKLERDNHQKAHPSYKFTPSKPNKPKPQAVSHKRRMEDDDNEEDDPEDPDWHGSKRMRRMGTPFDDEYEHSRSVYGGYHPQQQQHPNNRSAFHATNPGKPVPQPYDAQAAAAGHYYQTMQLRDGAVEHILYKKTPSPAMMHHPHNQHHGGYEYSQYGPPHPQQIHHPDQSPQQHGQYLDASQQHHQQQQLQHSQNHGHPQYHPQRVDPSLLPAGTTSDMLDLASYQQYPHTLDPAHSGGGPAWDEDSPVEGQQNLYLDQTTTFSDIGGYGLSVDDYGGDQGLLVQPEQERIFNQEEWQMTSFAADGDDWMEKMAELQTPTVGQLEGVPAEVVERK